VNQNSSAVHPTVRRLTVAVAVIALIPIGMGSLVTTLGAGMAFLDWPSSDGQNMLLYPWLQDFRSNPDKFVEHGHRLAGMLIGFMSILLVVITWLKEKQPWVRRMSVLVLVAVIAQGLLGGMRVRMDRQVLAMIHSITGAAFFCLCCMFAIACGKKWRHQISQKAGAVTPVLQGFALLLPVLVIIQYLLGGAFRHLNTMLDEHIVGAVVVSLCSLFTATGLLRSGNAALVRNGKLILAALGFQILLGLSAYVTRLGLPAYGYVATAGSLSQSVFCSAHTVGGMLLLNASVLTAFTMRRLVRNNAVHLIQPDEQTSLQVAGERGAS